MSARRGLLIGNSRWHWAEQVDHSWQFRHTPPAPDQLGKDPVIWAAVGRIPRRSSLNPALRITLADVSLQGCPAWLGVDRALGASAAWKISQRMGLDLSKGLLLVDAGTVLSQTLLNREGVFEGGQLMPGLQLQLAAMAMGTKSLPASSHDHDVPIDFPKQTKDAMVRGAIQSMVGSVLESSRLSGACVWLCGGDAETLADQIGRTGQPGILLDPDLVMKGLVDLLNTVN